MDTAAQLTSALAGRYFVEREIGAGGMATVYLARDLRHERRVALKVLKPELGAVLGVDRFLSEIKVTANLQHPNLLPLFDSGEAEGRLFYVMPFVEGESLRRRIDREKQLPLDEALHMAISIAGALDYAHRHGVIHRDLKPENILLHEGQPLIADFGIALAVSNAGGARITQTGLSLGTPQYMSPEQATGDRVIDGRTDIYSLGAVLYEMLTGDPPHLGSTAQAIIARVLTDRPRSVRTTRPAVPAQVSAAVDKALEKLPADRFATAHEFADALRGKGFVSTTIADEERSPVAHGPPPTKRPSLATIVATTIAIAASIVALVAWLRRPSPAAEPAARFLVTLPSDVAVDNVYAPLTLTHDGQAIIFRAAFTNSIGLARRRIDELEIHPIPGTDAAGWPVTSPDGKWVAYRSGDEIRKTPIDGGPSVPITALAAGNGTGLDWARNDMIIIGASTRNAGLSVVPASGGTPTVLTTPDTAAGEVNHGWPHALSDGNTVIYVSWPKEGMAGARLAITTLSSHKSKILDVNGTGPLGVVDGNLLYVSGDGVLMAVPFDVGAQKVTGAPIALIQGININRVVGAARAALSDGGTLVYLAGGSLAQMVAVDTHGTAQPIRTQMDNYTAPAWSPDGRRIAVTVSTGRGTDLWMCDASTGALNRITSDNTSTSPVWTFDGQRLVYSSARSGRQAVWWQPADGSAPAEKLFEVAGTNITEALLAPDGHTLIYRTQPQNQVFYVDLKGDRTPKSVTNDHFVKVHPALSPDGKWLAYTSNEGGTPQVVVRPFPGPGGATQVSVDGGSEPVWAPGGKTLFYRRARQVISVALALGPIITVGERRVLFEGPYVSPGTAGRQAISVSPDGKRFVLLKRLDDDSKIVVTTNWFTELRARLAGKR
jgi:eukaryotic-like serine/threonine-protein kinase